MQKTNVNTKEWPPEYVEIVDSLAGSGYMPKGLCPEGTLVCLAPFLFTWAIISGVSLGGYQKRWCFASLCLAEGALRDWQQGLTDEPKGYIRKTHVD
jgi:hypothetical protein